MAPNDVFEKIRSDLFNGSRMDRIKCLDNLRKRVESIELDIEEQDKALILKTLLNIFKDKTEACRERAVNLVTICVKNWNFKEDYVIYHLLPTIHKRLVCDIETEQSEEVYLCYIKLLNVILSKYGACMAAHLKEIVDILIAGIHHEHPEIKKESCDCGSQFFEKVPEASSHSNDLIKYVSKALKHKHNRVRVAAIDSLRNIVQFGRAGAIELVYGPMGECLLDHNALVKISVLRTASFWFLNLRDRYSYFHFLLPLILTLLEDENETIRDETMNTWNQIGLKYLKENEESLKDMQIFIPENLQHYPAGIKRPNLGCRILVQNEMMTIIPTLMRELEDWKINVRIKSSELLKSIIIHAESRIVSTIDILIPIMCRACQDKEAIVSKRIIETAEILGYFVASDTYWSLILNRIKEATSAGNYIILASLLKHSETSAIRQKLKELICSISSSDICEIKDDQSQKYLLTITSKLLDCCTEIKLENEDTFNFYVILLTLMALGNDSIQALCEAQIETISRIYSVSASKELKKQHLCRIFNRFSKTCEIWESFSTDFNIFITLLLNFADDVFEFVPNELLGLLTYTLDSKSDRQIIFKTLSSFVTIYQDKKFSVGKYSALMEKVILGPLKLQLIWRAGKVIEIIRCTAVSFVLLYLRNSSEVSAEFAIQVFPLLLGLCEDSYEESRIYSLQTLPYMKKLDAKIDQDIFVKSFTVASDRLNDRSFDVRMIASHTLKDLLLQAPDLNIYRNTSNLETVLKGLGLIFVTADEDDDKIREAILGIVKNQSIVKNIQSFMGENEIKNFIKKCRHNDLSSLLSEYLEI